VTPGPRRAAAGPGPGRAARGTAPAVASATESRCRRHGPGPGPVSRSARGPGARRTGPAAAAILVFTGKRRLNSLRRARQRSESPGPARRPQAPTVRPWHRDGSSCPSTVMARATRRASRPGTGLCSDPAARRPPGRALRTGPGQSEFSGPPAAGGARPGRLRVRQAGRRAP
jgi:hypothetical protein